MSTQYPSGWREGNTSRNNQPSVLLLVAALVVANLSAVFWTLQSGMSDFWKVVFILATIAADLGLFWGATKSMWGRP